jgi:hypothetical protein
LEKFKKSITRMKLFQDVFLNMTPPVQEDDAKSDFAQDSRISHGRRAAAAESAIHPEVSPSAHPSNHPYNRGSPIRTLNRSFNSGFDYDREYYKMESFAPLPTLVTAISPESHRGRAVITLAPNLAYGYNTKNLPNILQDGIHIDRFNGFNGAKDEFYRFHASKSRVILNDMTPCV